MSLAQPVTHEEGSSGTDLLINLAAGATTEEQSARPATLQRLPIDFDPAARYAGKPKLAYDIDIAVTGPAHFRRPEGSFEARAFGNTVHSFLEALAKRFAEGRSAKELLRDISDWSARIATVLRGSGLLPATIDRLTTRVIAALTNTLQDPEGQWLLEARNQSSSELALTSWTGNIDSLRIDRAFHAGEIPLAGGNNYLWIIDYKTTTHGRQGIEEFLAEERIKYAPQMEAYAKIIQTNGDRVRVGLYYPMLPRLIWWEP
jgi:hypothetical protein